MNARIKQLRDLVVALDLADRHLQPLGADVYQAAARSALRLTRDEMGLLPIGDFAGPPNALQGIAENIFFASNRCMPDLDGSGHAGVAHDAATVLLERMRLGRYRAGQAVADRLFTRLRAPAAPRDRRTARGAAG